MSTKHNLLLIIYKVQKEAFKNSGIALIPREKWDMWDPMLISEGLFSSANIFRFVKILTALSSCDRFNSKKIIYKVRKKHIFCQISASRRRDYNVHFNRNISIEN